jgi:hypothetical protein
MMFLPCASNAVAGASAIAQAIANRNAFSRTQQRFDGAAFFHRAATFCYLVKGRGPAARDRSAGSAGGVTFNSSWCIAAVRISRLHRRNCSGKS